MDELIEKLRDEEHKAWMIFKRLKRDGMSTSDAELIALDLRLARESIERAKRRMK